MISLKVLSTAAAMALVLPMVVPSESFAQNPSGRSAGRASMGHSSGGVRNFGGGNAGRNFGGGSAGRNFSGGGAPVARLNGGGRAPMAKPARRARRTSLPLTASIHRPASRTRPSTLALELAFMA